MSRRYSSVGCVTGRLRDGSAVSRLSLVHKPASVCVVKVLLCAGTILWWGAVLWSLRLPIHKTAAMGDISIEEARKAMIAKRFGGNEKGASTGGGGSVRRKKKGAHKSGGGQLLHTR